MYARKNRLDTVHKLRGENHHTQCGRCILSDDEIWEFEENDYTKTLPKCKVCFKGPDKPKKVRLFKLKKGSTP